eukprot:305358-Pleurochrysis_carterae.AAC.1
MSTRRNARQTEYSVTRQARHVVRDRQDIIRQVLGERVLEAERDRREDGEHRADVLAQQERALHVREHKRGFEEVRSKLARHNLEAVLLLLAAAAAGDVLQ